MKFIYKAPPLLKADSVVYFFDVVVTSTLFLFMMQCQAMEVIKMEVSTSECGFVSHLVPVLGILHRFKGQELEA